MTHCPEIMPRQKAAAFLAEPMTLRVRSLTTIVGAIDCCCGVLHEARNTAVFSGYLRLPPTDHLTLAARTSMNGFA